MGMHNRIYVDSTIHFGKPCVLGTRIPVQNVLELILAGENFTTISNQYYPELAVEDIQACIQYAISLIANEEIHLHSAL